MGKMVKLDGKPFEKKEAKKPSLMLGRPIGRNPMWENQLKFQRAFLELGARGYKMNYDDMESLGWWLKPHTSARNAIADAFVERGDDYLIFIDDDMTFIDLADDVEKMIALDKDIVMAICSCKPAPHFPNLGKIEKIGESGTICDSVIRHIYDFPLDKPFETDCGSAALLCIKKKVFQKMKKPWFYFPPNYTTGNAWGEDITFMFNAKMYGLEIWVDPTITMGHLGYTAWHHTKKATHYLDFKEDLIKEAKRQGWDSSHKLYPDVQKEFKKGLGPKKMFV